MSNRRRRQAARLLVQFLVIEGTPADALAIGLAYQCPDCSAQVGLSDTTDTALLLIDVAHDDSCPWLRRQSG